jgi:hypothetical protein
MLRQINQTYCTSNAQTSAYVPYFDSQLSPTDVDDFLYDVQVNLRNIPISELTLKDRLELPDAGNFPRIFKE